MKCPHCSEEFVITWKRYFKAPFGKHTCPSCRKKSKLIYTKKYIFYSLLPTALLAAILSILFNDLSRVNGYYHLFAIGIILIIAFPWDKYADNHFGKLKK
jgi:uncharacterized membrane protein